MGFSPLTDYFAKVLTLKPLLVYLRGGALFVILYLFRHRAVSTMQTLQEHSFDEALLAEAHQFPVEYRANLLAMMRIFRESITLPSAEASFQKGWQEAVRGETLPVSALWGDIDAA
jgi:hypothetical protein